MAGNPFRRPAGGASQAAESTSPSNKIKTTKKKVKIQTPPRSPEEPPRRLSAGRVSPPPPRPPEDDGDSDSTAGEPELEEAARNTRRNSGSVPPTTQSAGGGSSQPSTGAPYNPFARTLATSEATISREDSTDQGQDVGRQDDQEQHHPGNSKAHLDVDQFKNILLTGSAGPSSGPSLRYPDSSSNTDASSVSKQSLFDPSYEIHPGTPRSSIDQMESLESASDSSSSDEEDSSLITGPNRLDDLAPQIPPKSLQGDSTVARHPQIVSFADFNTSAHSKSVRSISSDLPVRDDTMVTDRLAGPQRTASGLNNPLPTSPQETPNTNDQSTQQKKAAPPLPAARRKGLERDRSDPKLSSEQKVTRIDEAVVDAKPTDTGSKSNAPPPPPSRRGRPLSQSAAPSTGTRAAVAPSPPPRMSETRSARPPPPPRSSPKRSSTNNLALPTAALTGQPQEKAPSSSQNAPQASPPRRSGVNSSRTSIDGRPPSIGDRRRSSEYSGKANAEKLTSLSNFEDVEEDQETQQQSLAKSSHTRAESMQNDVLASMTAFQAEVDALRARSGNAG